MIPVTYTLWRKDFGSESFSELWVGDTYSEVLSVVLEITDEGDVLDPQSAQFTAAAHRIGRPVSVWTLTKGDDKSLIVITKEGQLL